MSHPLVIEHLRHLLHQGRFIAHRAALEAALWQLAEGMVEGRVLPRAEAVQLGESLSAFAFTESLPALAAAAPAEHARLRDLLDASGVPAAVPSDGHDRILASLGALLERGSYSLYAAAVAQRYSDARRGVVGLFPRPPGELAALQKRVVDHLRGEGLAILRERAPEEALSLLTELDRLGAEGIAADYGALKASLAARVPPASWRDVGGLPRKLPVALALALLQGFGFWGAGTVNELAKACRGEPSELDEGDPGGSEVSWDAAFGALSVRYGTAGPSAASLGDQVFLVGESHEDDPEVRRAVKAALEGWIGQQMPPSIRAEIDATVNHAAGVLYLEAAHGSGTAMLYTFEGSRLPAGERVRAFVLRPEEWHTRTAELPVFVTDLVDSDLEATATGLFRLDGLVPAYERHAPACAFCQAKLRERHARGELSPAFARLLTSGHG